MKPVFQVLVAVIAIIALGALILSFSMDRIIKSNIEQTTSDMLDTSVEVNDASISILDGTGSIDGITIHNPEGFSDNPAVKLQQISIKMDLATILSDTVIIDSIEIKQPEVYFEQKGAGINLEKLSESLNEAPSTDINLIVDYLLVEEGLIKLTTETDEVQSTETTFDRFELTGIGREENNTIEQTVRQILRPVLERAAQEAVEQGLLDAAKEKLKDVFENG